MNFNQLRTGTRVVTMAFSLSLLLAACNNDQSGNNSTTGTGGTDTSSTANSNMKAPDTSAANNTATTNGSGSTKTAKKKGKVSMGTTTEDANEKMMMDKQGYYNRAEVAPTFAGGQNALDNYITSNIQYPEDAVDNNAEGVVKVQFAVDENGKISNVTTVGNKLGFGLEEEAIRVVSGMPKWTPGKIKGKNVKTWRTLPINYRLES